MNIYGTKKWEDKRKHILRRDHYMDQVELELGRHIPADTVHHIFPVDQYPQYAFADWNLISLSAETHNEMHDRTSRELTAQGRELMVRTGDKMGIPTHTVTLVIGMPGTGKSTWVMRHLGNNGLAFDLDAIAGAFRLRGPHEEMHEQARRMANDLFRGFLLNASSYSPAIYIIRTAPTIQEAQDIQPTEIVVMQEEHDTSRTNDISTERAERIEARITQLIEWAKHEQIPLTFV